MSDSRVKEIIRQGNKLFADKQQIDSLWEELALNFYPERADFTSTRYQGEEYADHLNSSIPVMARRELGNLVSSSLRPTAKKWFGIHHFDKDIDRQTDVRQYLEMLSEIQWRFVYEPAARFTRATKQADHDFVTFGNAVIYYGVNTAQTSLIFRNFHLKDCAWAENYEGKIDQLHRKWCPTAWQLYELYGDRVSNEVKKAVEKDPQKKFECRHIVVPGELYDGPRKRRKPAANWSLIVETMTENVLEQQGLNYFPFCVPRWHTMADSAYGLSMATMVLLPDGRTMQAVMRTIRSAGERYVEPPMIAIADAIRSDIALYPGGITTADMEYDEKLGEVLRPLTQDKGAFPIGFEIAEALKQDIAHGFFLDKIQLPEMNAKEMTAFEVQRRVQEHIRAASPIFEPIEQDYSAPLMEGVFELIKNNGGFPLDQMPEALSGSDVKFSFNSPLADMADQADSANYQNVVNMILAPMMQIDPAQLENANLTRATRDAMAASGWKAEWFNEEDAVEKKRQEIMQQQKAIQEMQMAQMAGQTGEQAGKAGAALKEAASDEQG